MELLNLVYKYDVNIEIEISNLKNKLKDKDIRINSIENEEVTEKFIKIYSKKEKYTDKLLTSINFEVAEMMYRIIVKKFHAEYIDEYLYENYFFLKEEEIIQIKKMCYEGMLCKDKIEDRSMIFNINRKNTILTKIVNCINENHELNIQGFLIFRMKEMIQELENISDKLIENYMIEKEYNEFIKLLKYFVEIQESKVDELNIIITKNGNYLLKDSKGKEIVEEILSDVKENNNVEEVNMEDMLISGLITNSPKNIIIHCIENCTNKELIETIKNVFGDRVKICMKCSMCEKE